MRVFISWSGETSKNIAEILRQWIPGVIQAAKPYYSPDDITKGTRWSSEISKELDASKIGIICLTKVNLESPWIMFEAGALSKNIDKSKVCPILFNVDPTDIQGPLIQFQAAKFSKSEMKKVVKMMNSELGDLALGNDVLDSVFEMWWPKLNEKIEAELSKAVSSARSSDLRPERDLLEEILSLTRDLSIVKSKRRDKDEVINFDALEFIARRIEEIAIEAREIGNPRLIELIDDLIRPFEYIIESIRSDAPISFREEILYRFRRVREMMMDLPRPVAAKPKTKRASAK